MKVILDNSFDSHWLYVDKFQKTTVNIIVKCCIDEPIDKTKFKNSINNLVNKHPYLSGSVKKDNDQHFILTSKEKEINHQVKITSKEDNLSLMSSLSMDLRKRLSIYDAELLNINLYRSDENSVVEINCSFV